MPETIRRIIFFLLTFQISGILSTNANCSLPDTWRGKWFQSGIYKPIVISSKHISNKGDCYDNQANKYLFREASIKCHRCVIIYERHLNVLQYRQNAFCEDPSDLELLCSNITEDDTVYTLIRMDAAPRNCPFIGAPFTFAYNRGYGDCKRPPSYLDTCTSNSHLLFRYRVCLDIQKTANTEEELECLGHWREGSRGYLVGKVNSRLSVSNEDMYRCFAFENTTDGGYRVARSGDATCEGLTSTQGSYTFTFTKAHTERCQFPSWLHEHRWQSLDVKNFIRMSPGNSSFDVEPLTGSTEGTGPRGGDLFSSFFSPGSRVQCEEVVQVSSLRISVKVIYIHQCNRQYICLNIYRRNEDVLEMQASVVSTECTSTDNDKMVTLVNPDAGLRDCPHFGKYADRGVAFEGPTVRDTCGPEMTNQSFHALIECDDQKALKFYSNCSQDHSQAFACHGSWEEGGRGFLIASPLNRSDNIQHTCFAYSCDPVTGLLTVFSSGDACRRHAGPEDVFASQLTVETGHCVAEGLISSSSRTNASVSVTSRTARVSEASTTASVSVTSPTVMVLSISSPIIAPEKCFFLISTASSIIFTVLGL